MKEMSNKHVWWETPCEDIFSGEIYYTYENKATGEVLFTQEDVFIYYLLLDYNLEWNADTAKLAYLFLSNMEFDKRALILSSIKTKFVIEFEHETYENETLVEVEYIVEGEDMEEFYSTNVTLH